MNFVKVALFALLLVLLLAPVSAPPSVSAHPDLCKEHHTNYAAGCASENTRCGSFCFYAVCHECQDRSHTVCDDDGNCSTHYYHESPCRDGFWHWNIFPHPDPGLDHQIDEREDEYDAPNLNDSVNFGMLRDDYVPPTSPCIVNKGDTSRGVTQLLPGEDLRPVDVLTPGEPSYISGVEETDDGYRITSLVDSRPSEIPIGDLSHLPNTPGEPGAVTLLSVTKVTDNSVTLQVSGGGVVQYRYWSYYGLKEPSPEPLYDGLELFEVAPSEFRVPFHNLGGEISVNRGQGGEIIVDRELQGIFSFQVRGLNADGDSTGNSNILHEMIGMADFHAINFSRRASLPFSLPIPAPPAWGRPCRLWMLGSLRGPSGRPLGGCRRSRVRCVRLRCCWPQIIPMMSSTAGGLTVGFSPLPPSMSGCRRTRRSPVVGLSYPGLSRGFPAMSPISRCMRGFPAMSSIAR